MSDAGSGRNNVAQPLPEVLGHAYRAYGAHTTQVSTIVRSLAITGLGVVWLFAGGLNSDVEPAVALATIASSAALKCSFLLCLSGLFLDGLHYVWGSANWGLYGWSLNRVWRARGRELSSKDVKRAWRLGSFYEIDRLVIWGLSADKPDAMEALALPAKIRKQKAQGLIGTDEGASRLAVAFSEPLSPGFINAGTLVLFWLKLGMTLSSYVVLGAFVLGIVPL